MASINDMSCGAFSYLLRFKRSHYLYSDKYLQEVGNSQDSHARTEKQHTVQWFADNATHGSGAYFRQRPNNSAKNAITNWRMLHRCCRLPRRSVLKSRS